MVSELLRKFVVGAALVVGCTRTSYAQEAPPAQHARLVTIDEAVASARTRGYDALVAEQAVRSAGADIKAARAVRNPVVMGGIGTTVGSHIDCPGCSTAIIASISDDGALSQLITGKRGLRSDIANAAFSGTRFDRDALIRALVLDVKQRYVALALAQETRAYALDIQAHLAKTVEIGRARYPKVIDEGALARIEVQKLSVDQDVDAAIEDVRVARAALAYVMGRRGPIEEFEVDENAIAFRVPASLANASLEQLTNTALARRAEIQSATEQVRRADAGLALARRTRIPDIALSVQYTQQGIGQNAVQPPTIIGALTAPLPLFYFNQGEIGRAEADLETQRIRRLGTSAQVVNDVAAAYASYVSARRQVERMQSELLARAKTARDIVEIQFVAGSVTLMDYLDAQRTYAATAYSSLQLLAKYWNAVFQLEQAIGVAVS